MTYTFVLAIAQYWVLVIGMTAAFVFGIVDHYLDEKKYYRKDKEEKA